MNKPLVSAIVSTYNSASFIKGKLDDLLSQTIADQLEIIVVNSGSRQNEEEIIKEYLHYPNIRYIKTEERESVYKAWNRGIKIASGEFITNSNTDDRLKKDALEILVSTLRKNPDVALVYPDQFITSTPNLTFEEVVKSGKLNIYRFPDYTYIRQIDRCLISSQPLWRASLHFKDNIWFDENYEICGDYDFTMNAAQKYRLLHLEEYLGVFYLSPSKENLSFKDTGRSSAEMLQISEPFIRDFIGSKDLKDLETIENGFKPFVSLPVPLFYLMKRLYLLLKPDLVRTKFFHTIEFIYFFSILLLEKQGRLAEAVNLSKKYLRYGKSNRISENLKCLLKQIK